MGYKIMKNWSVLRVASAAFFVTLSGVALAQTPTEVTLEQFGYGCSGCTPYGTGDAGPAIMAAIASTPSSAGVRVNFGPHQYNIVTPVVISKDYVWLQGQGPTSVLYYTPTTNNTAMITWHNPATVVPISFGRITDLMLISPDHTFVKTAIKLIDIGDMAVSGLYWAVWSDVTFNSVGLQTNGRQTSSFHDLRNFANIPIDIQPNPNSALAADHFHFWNLYLSPADTQPAIRAGNMLFTNTTFDGFQAWVGGTHGFYYNALSSAGRGTNLSFYNVRTENNPAVTQDPTAYSFYLNVPNGIGNILIKGTKLDEGRQGIYARGALTLGVEDCYYPPVSPAAMKFLDVDTTDLSVSVKDCRFETGVTQSLGGLALVDTDTVPSTSPIPTTAKYAVSATGTLTKSSIVNSGNILSSTFNNTVLTVPASTAFLTIGSGKSVGFENGLDFKGTDGTQITFQGTDTYVGRATTDTLTNKTIDGTHNTLINIPIANVSGLGIGVAATLGNNIGTGGAVVTFNGAGGMPASINLTNGSNLPISTGVIGLGIGVAPTLANNIGTGGAVVTFNGALGTPASGSASNLTGSTAAVDTSNTNLATNAYVLNQSAAATPLAVTNTAAVGTSTRYARADHVHAYENTAWTTYTPASITPQFGAMTGATVSATGKYKQIGKTVICQITVAITSVGSGSPSGEIRVSLPFSAQTAAGSKYIGSSFESAISGDGGIAYVLGDSSPAVSPTVMGLKDKSAATYWINGYIVTGEVTYEVP
jgi:hypothetical protein